MGKSSAAVGTSNKSAVSCWTYSWAGRLICTCWILQRLRAALCFGRWVIFACHICYLTIHWLSGKSSALSTIYWLALDILPIQGSSVPCERVFSSSKEPSPRVEVDYHQNDGSSSNSQILNQDRRRTWFYSWTQLGWWTTAVGGCVGRWSSGSQWIKHIHTKFRAVRGDNRCSRSIDIFVFHI